MKIQRLKSAINKEKCFAEELKLLTHNSNSEFFCSLLNGEQKNVKRPAEIAKWVCKHCPFVVNLQTVATDIFKH